MGRVILYADRITDSIKTVMDETNRRREVQRNFNKEHGITPQSVVKSVDDVLKITVAADGVKSEAPRVEIPKPRDVAEAEELVGKLEIMMTEAARNLDFERAAELRDEIAKIRKGMISIAIKSGDHKI